MSNRSTKMCSLSPKFMSMEEEQQISLPQKLTIQQKQNQQYALKWSEYQSSILNCFQRLRDEEDFVDVTLSCDQRSFPAHRIVLSACSPYFRKLLKANPCKHPIVILRDVHSDNLECLLSFMYNGEVNVNHDQLPDFLKTAHLLQIRGLTDVSENCHSSGCISSEGKSIDTLSANETCKLDSDRDICDTESAEKSNYFPKYRSSSELAVISKCNSTGVNSPPIKETKPSATACPQWENSDVLRNRKHHLTPPPQKRIKSADLFRAQHGISSDRAISEKEFSSFVHHSLTRDQIHVEESEVNFGHLKEGKLQSQNQQRINIQSTHDESVDEESNSSNEDDSDHDDKHQVMNESMDHQRIAMHNIFLGAPKPLEQQSVINLNDFGMGISKDRTTAATLHAAKMVQLNAIGQGFENLSATMIHPHFNLSKESITKETFASKGCSQANLSSEPILRQQLSCGVLLGKNIQALPSEMAEPENSSDDAKKNECQSTQNTENAARKHQTSYRELNNFENEVVQLEEGHSPKA